MAEVGIDIVTSEHGAAETQRNLERDMRRMGDAGRDSATRTSKAWGKVKSVITGVGGVIGKFMKKIFSLRGAIATLAGTGGIGLLLKSLTDAAGGFEKAMANVSTLVDTAIVDMKALGEEVLELSSVVNKPATELAEGLYQVVSAGIDASESIGVLNVSAKAAKAGLTDTFAAVDVITTILNAYGMEASAATKVSDILFKTVEQGKTTFDALANAMGTVVPFASQLDIGIEEVAAALAAMTKIGIDTNTATMSLRATFASIISASDETREKAAALGLEWSAAGLKAKGLVGFLNDLRDAIGDDTEAMTDLIPEIRAASAVMALTGDMSGELNEILLTMNDSLGATEVAFRKQEASYENITEKLGNLFDKIKIKLGNALLPVLKDFITNTLSPMLVKLEEWVEVNRELIGQKFHETISFISTAIKNIDWNSVISAIKSVIRTIDNLIGKLESVLNFIDRVVTRFRNLEFESSQFWETIKAPGIGIPIPSAQHGMPFVPRTGPVLLHRGEAVIPADRNPNNILNSNNTDNRTFNVSFNDNFSSGDEFEREQRIIDIMSRVQDAVI